MHDLWFIALMFYNNLIMISDILFEIRLTVYIVCDFISLLYLITNWNNPWAFFPIIFLFACPLSLTPPEHMDRSLPSNRYIYVYYYFPKVYAKHFNPVTIYGAFFFIDLGNDSWRYRLLIGHIDSHAFGMLIWMAFESSHRTWINK